MTDDLEQLRRRLLDAIEARLLQRFDLGGGGGHRSLSLCESRAWLLHHPLGDFGRERSVDHLPQLLHGTHFLFGEPAAAKSS